jgi:hypothetical protein
MRVMVRVLRKRGRLLPWREVLAAPPVEADLGTHYQQYGERCYHVATLRLVATCTAEAVLPPLYEPVLVGIAADSLRLRGFERLDDGQAVVQEWLCEVVRFVVDPLAGK